MSNGEAIVDLEDWPEAPQAQRDLLGENATALAEPISDFQTPSSSLHALLLIADSALPLGSFAFSSGLESYLAHKVSSLRKKPDAVRDFLELSLQSLASTSLPYVLAAYNEPDRLLVLDNDFDASMLCNVARRASVAQGKGFLAVWERAFSLVDGEDCRLAPSRVEDVPDDKKMSRAKKVLQQFTAKLKLPPDTHHTHNTLVRFVTSDQIDDSADKICLPGPTAHLAPLWGIITFLLSIRAHDSLYLFLFSHFRTVVSAAVRASVFGPYQAQALLASAWAQDLITGLLRDVTDDVNRAGQVAPVVDIWVGRHEMLYSRIFNS